MPRFLIAHRFPENFQGSPETAAAARAWFGGLGPNLESSTPTPNMRRLGNYESDGRQMAFTLISADNLETATSLAQGWPLLQRGGGIELRELADGGPTIPAA